MSQFGVVSKRVGIFIVFFSWQMPAAGVFFDSKQFTHEDIKLPFNKRLWVLVPVKEENKNTISIKCPFRWLPQNFRESIISLSTLFWKNVLSPNGTNKMLEIYYHHRPKIGISMCPVCPCDLSYKDCRLKWITNHLNKLLILIVAQNTALMCVAYQLKVNKKTEKKNIL